MKKFVLTVALFTVACLMLITANAETDASDDCVYPYAVAGNSAQVSLTLSDGTATGSVRVSVDVGYSSTTTLVLQKKNDQGGWTTVESVTGSDRQLMLSTSVSSGTYRLRSYTIVKNSSAQTVDTITKYSSEKTY